MCFSVFFVCPKDPRHGFCSCFPENRNNGCLSGSPAEVDGQHLPWWSPLSAVSDFNKGPDRNRTLPSCHCGYRRQKSHVSCALSCPRMIWQFRWHLSVFLLWCCVPWAGRVSLGCWCCNMQLLLAAPSLVQFHHQTPLPKGAWRHVWHRHIQSCALALLLVPDTVAGITSKLGVPLVPPRLVYLPPFPKSADGVLQSSGTRVGWKSQWNSTGWGGYGREYFPGSHLMSGKFRGCPGSFNLSWIDIA